MAIRYNNLDPTLKALITTVSDTADRVAYVPGKYSVNTLGSTGNIILDETVTIGADVYQFKAITTDSTRTGSLANASVPAKLTASGAMTWAAGDLLRLENEIVKIVSLVAAAPTTQAVVLRARCGTTAAAHTTVSIYQAAAATTTQIPVGYNATLTPAVWCKALAAEINNAAAGGMRASAKASTIYDPGPGTSAIAIPDNARIGKVVASVDAASATAVVVRSAIPEDSGLDTTETVTNAAFVNGATLTGGAVAAPKQTFFASRVPTAAEDTFDSMYFYVPFVPSCIIVKAVITASGIDTGWNGGYLFYEFDGDGIIKVDNAGASDWDVNDTIYVFASE